MKIVRKTFLSGKEFKPDNKNEFYFLVKPSKC